MTLASSKTPTPTLIAFAGVAIAYGPSTLPSQLHVGLQHAVLQLQQGVTRP